MVVICEVVVESHAVDHEITAHHAHELAESVALFGLLGGVGCYLASESALA